MVLRRHMFSKLFILFVKLTPVYNWVLMVCQAEYM
jgi:hypothetical protein